MKLVEKYQTLINNDMYFKNTPHVLKQFKVKTMLETRTLSFYNILNLYACSTYFHSITKIVTAFFNNCPDFSQKLMMKTWTKTNKIFVFSFQWFSTLSQYKCHPSESLAQVR